MTPHRTQKTLEQEIDDAIAHLRSLAEVDGRSPRQTDFNNTRPPHVRSSSWLAAHGISYSNLVDRAGLIARLRFGGDPYRGGGKPRFNGVPLVLEEEIQAAFNRGDHRPMHHHDWPLQALEPVVTIRFSVDARTGETIKITEYRASLR